MRGVSESVASAKTAGDATKTIQECLAAVIRGVGCRRDLSYCSDCT